jgi:hypothetical protein
VIEPESPAHHHDLPVDIVQITLHENEIEPPPPLLTDSGHSGHFIETKSRVELDRSNIARIDTGDHDPLAAASGMSTEGGDQCATDPTAPVVAGNVDGMLDRESVAGPTSRIAEVSIGCDPNDVVAFGGNEYRVAGQLFLTEPELSFPDGVEGLGPLIGRGIEEGVADLRDGGDII